MEIEPRGLPSIPQVGKPGRGPSTGFTNRTPAYPGARDSASPLRSRRAGAVSARPARLVPVRELIKLLTVRCRAAIA